MYDASMHRELSITLDEHKRTGLLVARAVGMMPANNPTRDEGAWYSAAESAHEAIGGAASAAAYGEDNGVAFPTAEEAIAFALCLRRCSC